MGIWKLVASKAEAVKRNAPDATPVKNACRNSYNRGSAAFAKIDRTVRTIALRRAAQPTLADDILPKVVETDRGVIGSKSMKNGCTNYCPHGYVFTTFAKIGYTFRVKCVYRIVHMMKKDGADSIAGIYATSFSQNIELHEYKVGDDVIPGQAFAMPMKKECMNSYTFGFITFAKISNVVRVNVSSFVQWIGDDDTKSKMDMCSTIFAKNVRRYVLLDCYKLIPGGLGVRLLFVLLITLKDIMDDYRTQSSGDLKDEGRFSKVKEFLVLLLNDIITLMMREPFRTQFFSKAVFTIKSFALFVRELLVCTMKRYFGAQYLCQVNEIVAAIMKLLFSTRCASDFEIHEATWMKSLPLIVRGLFVLIMKKHFGSNFWSQPEEMVEALSRALFGICWTKDFEIHEATKKKRGKKKG